MKNVSKVLLFVFIFLVGIQPGPLQGIIWSGNWAFGCNFNNRDLANTTIKGELCSRLCISTPKCTHYVSLKGGTCLMKYGTVSKSDAFEINDRTVVCGVITRRCTNDSSTDFQLTASGFYVDSSASCVSACNLYHPTPFSYAFFLEGQLCFCRNASLPALNMANFNSSCETSTCLNDNSTSDCFLSSYEVFALTLGIQEWNITFNPAILLVDNEIQIQTNILRGDASSAYVRPVPNNLSLNVQRVSGMTVGRNFYLPGLQQWSQEIGSIFANPFVVTTWIKIDEKVGGIYVIPSVVPVNDFYNFILVITEGTNISVTLLLPMNKAFFLNSDIIRLAYGFDLLSIYNSSKKTCSLSGGFILKQVLLTFGCFTKVKLKVSHVGTLEIAILRPICSSPTTFCSFTMACASSCFSSDLLIGDVAPPGFSTITALVVTRFIFLLNNTGLIEIPIENKNNVIQENDMVWIGGNASLFCNGTTHEQVQGVEIGKTIVFSTNGINNEDFFISFFISKPIERLIPISSNTVGTFSFTVDVSNHVPSFKHLDYSFNFQIPVSGLKFAEKKPVSKFVAGYKINTWVTLKAMIDNGSDVTYAFSIPKLNYSEIISNDDTVYYFFDNIGIYTVYLTAANKVNSLTTSIDVAVLSEISGINLYTKKSQLQNNAFNITVTIFNGNDVQLIVDFGDGTPVTKFLNINATGVDGATFTVTHMYSTCNMFTINASAMNLFTNTKETVDTALISSFTEVVVFYPLSPMNVITIPIVSLDKNIYLFLSKSITLYINQNKGSYLVYSIDWGDGNYEIKNQTMNQNPVSFQVQHKYNKENNYTVNVTCYNLLQSSSFLTQIVVQNCSVPGVSFYYGTVNSPMNIVRSIGGDLTAFVENVDLFCKPESYSFKWNLASSISNASINGFLFQQKVTYSIRKNSLNFGIYILTLQYNYGAVSNVYTAYINIVFSPLYIEINNGFFSSIAYKKQIGNDTLYQNFTISAKSSYDPDDPAIGTQNIYFNWRCKVSSNFSVAQEIMKNYLSLNLAYRSDTCFDQNWISISSVSAEVYLSTQQFLEGLSYHVEVCGTKHAGKDVMLTDIKKTGCYLQELKIVAPGFPSIAVRCISNCDAKLNFKDRTIYSYLCEDCGSQKLTAEWKITDDTGNVPLEVMSQGATTTGFLTPSLVIHKDILLESKNYTFTLVVGFTYLINKVEFKCTRTTSSKPSPGVCFINPTDGYALETFFKIVCYDWVDLDGFLNYKFYYDNSQSQQMNLSSPINDYPMLNSASITQPSLSDFLMGPGDEKNDFKISIIIRVNGKYNTYTEYNKLFIKVRPNNKSINLTELLTGISLNDTQSVAYIVQAVGSTINKNSAGYYNDTPIPLNKFTNMEDIDARNQANLEKQQKLLSLQKSRTEMIELLSNVPISDMSSLKSIGDALALSSQNPMELVPQSQNQAANILIKLADLLTKENLKGVGADSFESMTQPLVNSVSNLFEANFNNIVPGSSTTSISNVEVSKDMVIKLFKALENYFIAVQSYKVPGESPTTGVTKQFNFILKKDFLTNLSNTSIGSSDGGFTLPDSKDIFNESVQNEQVLLNSIRMKTMAYTWDTARSQNILSETQSLSFSDTNGYPMKVSDSSQPINIAIKNSPEKMTGKNISLSMPSDVYQIRLPLKADCNMLIKFVSKNEQNNLTNLIVFIQYGKVATKLDHDIMLNISAKYGVVVTKNNSTVFNSNVTNTTSNFFNFLLRNQDSRLLIDGTLMLWNFFNSTYAFLNKTELHLLFSYVGPIPEKKLDVNLYTFDEAEYAGTFDYEMKSFCAECNYWNENADQWKSDGCQYDVQTSTFLLTKCKCNHLTAFGGFFVAPNPIPKPTLSALKSGYVLFVTVGIVILLWILGLIFTRKMDKKDVSKIGVCPLLDNQASDTYLYQVIVNTSSRRYAGTKSNIFFAVSGDINDSGVRRLKGSERECFQRSNCDVFIMTTHTTLGDLDFIRLWHDNSGGGWHLRNIIIVDLQTEKQFLFIGHCWIAVDRGSCRLDYVIPVASAEETSDFNYVFSAKAAHDLCDSHLWFSIFARPPKSNFTRCQRLSVAVSLLMTSMVASTMFYGKMPPANPSTENKVASFSFTWGQVFIAIVSSCITIPINVILVGVFRSIKPFENIKDSSDENFHWNDEEGSSSPSPLIRKNSNKKTSTIYIEKSTPSLIKKQKIFYLPRWCLYMAWFICVCCIFGCGVIVLLYGIAFGNNKSLNWLSSVSLGLIQDMLVIQPIKIFILSIFFALIKKQIDEDTCELEKQGKMLAHDESWLHKPKNELSIFERNDVNLQPPDSSLLTKMKELGYKKMKMYAITQELVLYTFYAILVFYIGYMTRENFAFYQTRNVEELFNLRPDVSYPDGTIFTDIQSSQDFWPWMEDFFLPQVYPEPWYNLSDFYENTDKQNFPGKLFLNDLTSKIVNGIRIRQIRVQLDSCIKAVSVFDYIKLNCLSSYSPAVEETNGFDFNWSFPIKYKSAINPSTMPWRYQTWQELDGYPYAANLETYYGGGYVIEIFPKWRNQDLLDEAKSLRWIDRQTRALLIEFALFNPATNYFNMVTMVLEFPAAGGAVPSFSVLTFKLYTSTKGTGFAMLGSQILFILMMCIFAVRECRFLYRTGWIYFREFWNLVEVALILLTVLAVGFFFYKAHLAKVLLQRMPAKKPQSFINFQFASYWDLTYLYIVSLIVFFVTLKFIKLLRFNRRVSMLSSTLKAAWYPLSMFGIVFVIILCTIVSFSSIVFGMLLDGYQTYFKTVASIISLLLGKFSYSQFENAHSVFGPIFFFGFNFMINWIVMNMFLSILNDIFTVVRANLDKQDNDHEMIGFVMEHIKDWFGWRSSKKIELAPNNENEASKKKPKRRKKRFDAKFKRVENEMFCDNDLKNTLLDEKFSKCNYFLNEDGLDSETENETLVKCISFTNLLCFDDASDNVVLKMTETVKLEI